MTYNTRDCLLVCVIICALGFQAYGKFGRSNMNYAFSPGLSPVDLIGGRVVVPDKVFNATIWPGYALTPGWQFPELSSGDYGIPALQAKPNFGVGVSGGGLRATALALGWLRGLHSQGFLQKARYLGSASGGSMANVLVTYGDPARLKARLGAYVPPEEATIRNLQAAGGKGSFVRNLVDMDNFYQSFLENLVRAPVAHQHDEGNATAGAFTRTVGQLVLRPTGLQQWNSTVTSRGTRGNVHAKIEQLAKQLGVEVYSALQSPDLPFPILCGNVFDPTAKMPFFPIEFTPLYFGCPGDFSGSPNKFNLTGKGVMEPLAFNAKPTSTPPSAASTSQTTITVNSSYVTPLASQVAVSGGLLAVTLQWLIQAAPGEAGTLQSAEWGMPYFRYMDIGNAYRTELYPFADGGYIDNEGLWAMLRRKVKKVLIFYATANGSEDKDTWSAANTGLSLPFGACSNCYEGDGLDVPTHLMNNVSQVFRTSEFDALFNTYVANQRAGRVNWFNATLEVLENKFMGVPGGWKVDLMVVFNSYCSEWEKKLPAKTYDLIQAGRDPNNRSYNMTKAEAGVHYLQTYELNDFPFPNIGIFRYGSLMAGALSNFATYQVMQLKTVIEAFINRPDA